MPEPQRGEGSWPATCICTKGDISEIREHDMVVRQWTVILQRSRLSSVKFKMHMCHQIARKFTKKSGMISGFEDLLP